MSSRQSALWALACVLQVLPGFVACSGSVDPRGSAGAGTIAGAGSSNAGNGGSAASGAGNGGSVSNGAGNGGSASSGAGAGGAGAGNGGAGNGGAGNGGQGGAAAAGSAAGGAANCSRLSQTRSARTGKSAGFSGDYMADYYPLYDHGCGSVAECSAACVSAGGTQTSCAASECIESTKDYCLPPTYWFDFDKLLTEGNTIESSVWVIMVNNPYRDQLLASNFQFELPSSAKIAGISFSINEAADSENMIGDYSVRALQNELTVGLDRGHSAAWTTTFHPEIYGGPEDLWGASWSAELVNAPGFGVALTPLYLDGAGNARAYVDFIRATVTYDVCK